MNLLDELKDLKKRSRETLLGLEATIEEETRIQTILAEIMEKVTQLPSNEERQSILSVLSGIATQHKTKYDEAQNVMMSIEREISFSSDEGEKKKKKQKDDSPTVMLTVMPKDTFVVPVLSGAEFPLVATSHLSRAYILTKTDIHCKHCVQSRNETFSGWFTEKHGFDIKKCRLDPQIEEESALLIGQWKADGYDIKATKNAIKFISLEQARTWYERKDIGHAKQLESLKKNCTHSPSKSMPRST
jgi:hypothetical protein